MAKAKSSLSNRVIENVRIVHSEDDLEPVVRRLAVGLEQNLKLPGQADYDREAAPSPEYVLNQLKKVCDMGVATVLYISDDFLKVFKKKKKQVDMLKNILQKDAETQNNRKNIVILWGELKDKDLVKKVLGVDHSKIQKGQFCDLRLANFSLNEVGNIVEAVLKLWSGSDAELPKPTHDTSPEIESLDTGLCSKDPGLCETRETSEKLCRSAQPTVLHVCAIHFDKEDLPFVSKVAFLLMQYMKLEKSVDFFSLYENDDSQMISKSLAQLKNLQQINEKAVVILNKHLLNLLSTDCEAATKFESLCQTAVEETNNVVFLLKNLTLDDVRQCSESMATIISRKCNVYKQEYEDRNHLETLVFDLKRFLTDGAAIESDESTMVRPMKEEYADYKRNMVGSNGESIPAELVAPTPGPLPGLSEGQTGLNTNGDEKNGDSHRHIITSNGVSLHMKGLEQNTGTDFNHRNSSDYKDGGQANRISESLQQGSSTEDSERTVSKLDGFSGYYLKHQMQPSHSGTMSAETVCDSNKTMLEQPTQNEFSPGCGKDLTSKLNQQTKSSISFENDKEEVLALRSRATTDSSQQDPSTHQLTAGKTDGNKDFKQAPQHQLTHPAVAIQERKSEPTLAPAPHPQYLGASPRLPDSYSQRNTQPMHMPQHPVSQQSSHPNYGMQSQGGLRGYAPFAEPSHHQFPVTGPASSHGNNLQWHQNYHYSASPALTAEDFSRGVPSQYHRMLSQPVQPSSAQHGQLPLTPGLQTSRSTPGIAGSNLAVPMGKKADTFLIDLDTKLKQRIGMKLNSTKVSGFYWKHFAEEIGVSHDEIRYWESISCNYMDKLYEWLGTKRDEYPVSEFKTLADRLERPDIVKILTSEGY